MANRKSLLERFEEKYIPVPESGCWIWLGCVTRGEYGMISNKGKMFLAHRISWELHNGPIPAGDGYHGLCVLHKCDETLCVRPEHLMLGSHADNMRDMVEKGRSPRGEKVNTAKLSEQDVREIRQLRKNGVTAIVCANKFGVCINTIFDIQSGRKWGWLK